MVVAGRTLIMGSYSRYFDRSNLTIGGKLFDGSIHGRYSQRRDLFSCLLPNLGRCQRSFRPLEHIGESNLVLR